MSKEIMLVVDAVSNEKGVDKEVIFEALEAALESHAIALAASKTVTEGLVRSIAAEVAAVRSGPAGYGRTGSFSNSTPRQASGVALNAKA